MKQRRLLFTVALGASLACWVALASIGGAPSDLDGDGIVDSEDNCLTTPNGPLAGTYACFDQLDGDRDGFGNPCDLDTNNDLAHGLDDVAATWAKSAVVSTDPNFDHDCDGAVRLFDVALIWAESITPDFPPPGPSGLACAGTIPCP